MMVTSKSAFWFTFQDMDINLYESLNDYGFLAYCEMISLFGASQ